MVRFGKTEGRFRGVLQILQEDVGLIAAAWLRSEPQRRDAILHKLQELDVSIPREPLLRFTSTQTPISSQDYKGWSSFT